MIRYLNFDQSTDYAVFNTKIKILTEIRNRSVARYDLYIQLFGRKFNKFKEMS